MATQNMLPIPNFAESVTGRILSRKKVPFLDWSISFMTKNVRNLNAVAIDLRLCFAETFFRLYVFCILSIPNPPPSDALNVLLNFGYGSVAWKRKRNELCVLQTNQYTKHCCKFYSKIIRTYNRLNLAWEYVISEVQTGFKKGRDQVLISFIPW